MIPVRRIYVEKREGFTVESDHLLKDIKENLLIKGISKIRILNRYDSQGILDEEYDTVKRNIFS